MNEDSITHVIVGGNTYRGLVRMFDKDSGLVRIREQGGAERQFGLDVKDLGAMNLAASALCEQFPVEVEDNEYKFEISVSEMG